jgi:hypothetical protein
VLLLAQEDVDSKRLRNTMHHARKTLRLPLMKTPTTAIASWQRGGGGAAIATVLHSAVAGCFAIASLIKTEEHKALRAEASRQLRACRTRWRTGDGWLIGDPA